MWVGVGGGQLGSRAEPRAAGADTCGVQLPQLLAGPGAGEHSTAEASRWGGSLFYSSSKMEFIDF